MATQDMTPGLVSQLTSGTSPSLTGPPDAIAPSAVDQTMAATSPGTLLRTSGATTESAQYYRKGSGLYLVVYATQPGATVGYPELGEGWETISGTITVPLRDGTTVHTYMLNDIVAAAWAANKTAAQATITTAFDNALTTAGYTVA